jgi:aminopeptidase N
MPCFQTDPWGAPVIMDRDFALPDDRAHYAPDRPVDVRHVALDVRVDFAQKTITGTCATTVSALFDDVREVTLQATEMTISAVTFTSKRRPQPVALDWNYDGAFVRIALDRPLRYGAEATLTITYQTAPRIGLNFVGPSKGDPDMAVQAHTQGQPEYAHYWFPCHDSPNDRATFALAARVPAPYFALSNGKLERIEEHPASNERTYHYSEAVPFPAYIATLAVGELSEIVEAFGETPVQYYVRPGFEDHARRALRDTPAMLAYYSEKFGVRYPYEKYAQIFLEDFTGAMENTSATSHSWLFLPDERDFIDWERKSTVAHELVHQWFGDLLTCRDWSHAWLNESFATYFEETWKQVDPEAGEEEFRLGMRNNQRTYQGEDRVYRRPIVHNVYFEDGQELFDRHLYEKGSCVLHMLRGVVGEAAFWRGIARYCQTNRGREVITADLERAFEEATGRSLGRFFAQWVYRGGHPDFDVSYEWDSDQRLAKLTVKQTQRVDELTPLFATPIEIAFTTETKGKRDTKTFTVQVEQAAETFVFPLAARPTLVRFDPYGWVLKTVKFDRPVTMVRWQLANDSDPLGRLEAAEALGKQGDPASEKALITALQDDPFWAVQAEAAQSLGKMASQNALAALVSALATAQHPKVRRAIAAALGEFHGPERAEEAHTAADTLTKLLATGDQSYRVEAAAAQSLGKTKDGGAAATLMKLTKGQTWFHMVETGALLGLAEVGTPEAARELATIAADLARPMLMRSGALSALRLLIQNGQLDPQSREYLLVRDALIAALDDPWVRSRSFAVLALRALDDAAVLPALERALSRELASGVKRGLRLALLALRSGKKGEADIRRVRRDVEEMREENRKLRDRLTVLEARNGNGHATNGNGNGHGAQVATSEVGK